MLTDFLIRPIPPFNTSNVRYPISMLPSPAPNFHHSATPSGHHNFAVYRNGVNHAMFMNKQELTITTTTPQLPLGPYQI